MDVRQSPPRILYIATWIVIIGILGSLQWLITAPPTAFVNYQPLLALHPCGYWWRIHKPDHLRALLDESNEG
ncbi:MAG: hypothetical protein ACXVCM_26285, partial [Ktedonobacteraceae bacterium]